VERQELVERLEFLLVSQGHAQLRTGKRRTETVARALLKEAADNIGAAVTTTKGKGFVKAKSKG